MILKIKMTRSAVRASGAQLTLQVGNITTRGLRTSREEADRRGCAYEAYLRTTITVCQGARRGPGANRCRKATIRRRRLLLFAGALLRQNDGRLPKWLVSGKLVQVGGEDPGPGRLTQHSGLHLRTGDITFLSHGRLDGRQPTTVARENKS